VYEKVKKALRVTTAAFDNEIKDIVTAAIADLRLSGVNVPGNFERNPKDSLLVRAVIAYAKAHFGDNENSEKFLASYESMRRKIYLAGDYRVG